MTIFSPGSTVETLADPASSEADSVPPRGALHAGTAHVTPVKLFKVNPDFCQRLHGFPVRSRARNLSLIAPVLAFGPSLSPLGPISCAGSLDKLRVSFTFKNVSFRVYVCSRGEGIEGPKKRCERFRETVI
jgi:hypothetical protein